jgi:hypothetical protein
LKLCPVIWLLLLLFVVKVRERILPPIGPGLVRILDVAVGCFWRRRR